MSIEYVYLEVYFTKDEDKKWKNFLVSCFQH